MMIITILVGLICFMAGVALGGISTNEANAQHAADGLISFGAKFYRTTEIPKQPE